MNREGAKAAKENAKPNAVDLLSSRVLRELRAFAVSFFACF
jgi:hypothetical protein